MPRRHAVALLTLAVSALAPHRSAGAQGDPATSQAGHARLRLARPFGSHMVLQRGAPIRVWGWASPGAPVSAAWRGRTAHAIATPAGRWQLSLAATPAGGPYVMAVQSGGEHIELHDVMVGDVWLAGGQSNMELPVTRARDAAMEIAAAHDSLIRQFKVPISWSDTVVADVAGGEWLPADPRHVGAFTAVGYFFARAIRRSERVPIGIVNSTWGGSAIETWMSRRASGLSDSAIAATKRAERAHVDSLRAALRTRLGDLPEADAGMSGSRALWADPALDDSAWREIAVPAYWESQGYDGVDGVGWYRTEIALAQREIDAGVTLSLAAVDDDDVTWVNGVEVGRTAGYDVRRSYRLPAGALHVGRNSLVVRVADHGGGGGINGAAALSFGDGTTRSLAGRWKFRVGQLSFAPDGQRINKLPTVAYNAMIAPLLPLAIRGVLWYQGESNANNLAQATAYRAQFATLIESWRREWGTGRDPFPFLWVQLPNFGPVDTVPPPAAASAWATQRESMDAALALPNTGRAVTIDVGEAGDIHPREKQTVGERLARVALAVAYHRPVPASGPSFRSQQVRGNRILVAFDHAGAGLVSHAADSMTVGAFAVAGADRRFVRAHARVVGNQVEVWSDAVAEPVAIRYAWANDPAGPLLYDRDGLPAAPFRTDRW